MPQNEFIIRSERVVSAEGLTKAAVHVRDGKIAALHPHDRFPAGIPVQEFGNLVVMPGLVDSHVHINEPGRTEWEGFETATKAAAAGGITTLVDMPLNSSPVTTTAKAFHEKMSAAKGKLWVDCGFYGGVVPGNAADIQPLADAGVLGFKAFLVHSGIDEFPNATEQDLRAAMPVIAKNDLPLLVHCELITNPNSSQPAQSGISNPKSFQDFLRSRPRQWEHDAIALMIRLCREYNCRTHIVHLSSADAVGMLNTARSEKLPLTVETCPHYLYFTSEEIPDGDTRFKCTPPIRERENRDRLLNALREGTIEMIVSDHSPSTPELKCFDSGDLQKAWGGIPSLQFGLSIIWTLARKQNLAIEAVSRWMSGNPAKLVNLENKKGSLEPGFDADIVVWDPEAQFTVNGSSCHHRHKVTPYDGRTLFGVVTKTYLRGEEVFDGHSFSAAPTGTTLLNR
ncbi:MAG TPA: allantoinase AllB [Bacteroidota bacterium]|nr:allantoinase AllB [Bacteroidota bacterium]